jgi:hypothetical protein
MTGKIFPESSNIYQDQAKVLFDFYRQAAEAIVSDEERLEKEKAVANELVVQLQSEVTRMMSREKIRFGAGGALVLVGVGLFFVYGFFGFLGICPGAFVLLNALSSVSRRKQKQKEQQDALAQVDAISRQHSAIRRDYRVQKLGVAYIPVAAQIPFENKSFFVDFSASSAPQAFQLCTLRDSELFSTTITELDQSLRNIPLVEPASQVEAVPCDHYSRSIQEVPYYDYMGEVNRKLRVASQCMENLDRNSVTLPIIFPDSDYAKFIATYGTTAPGNAPVVKVFNTNQYDEELARFESLNQMKKSIERHSSQFDVVLRRMMNNVAVTVQALTMVKMASTSKLIENSNRLLFNILKAPYNHYSPKLECEEIDRIRNETFDFEDTVEQYRPFALKQSSRVSYDLFAENWVAEDGSRTNFPFGMLQIEEEIFAPIVQSLMLENRVERLKIYNGIKDQKIDYLNQWHRDTEDFYGRNRAESQDIVNQMRATFTEYVAAYNQLISFEKTEKNMSSSGSLEASSVTAEINGAEMVSAYELKSQEFLRVQEEFGAYMGRLKEDIDRRAEKFGFIEFFDASLRDGHAKAFAESVNRVNDLDARRKALVGVNPYFAATSELPPPPSIEAIAHEHFSLNLNATARHAILDLDGPSASAVSAPA